jgi:hypothetical protein
MNEPKPDPGNSGPDKWAGDPVDDSEDLKRALNGDYDKDRDDDE